MAGTFGAKIMDHSEYPKRLKKKTEAQLRFIIQDAREAIAAMPEGPNVSYYSDEICYCANELMRRGL